MDQPRVRLTRFDDHTDHLYIVEYMTPEGWFRMGYVRSTYEALRCVRGCFTQDTMRRMEKLTRVPFRGSRECASC